MYSIYARKGEERICIYNDAYQLEETTLIDPKLELAESLAGTFKTKLPAKNNGYEFGERLNTEIIIYKNKKEIWSGRVIKEDTDFWKNRSIECEGELAYLNDTIQPQAEYTEISPARLLQTYLDIHNTKAPDDKKFSLGIVTVTKDLEIVLSNYESTLEAIGEKLVNKLGGFLRIRKVDGVRYLDYIREEDRNTSTQIIRFGKNLLDFTKTYDATEFCTVLLPLGGRLTEEDGSSASDIEGLEAYVTVEDVNEGSPYIVNADTIEEFGWIEKKVTWNDIEEPEDLKEKAVKYLEEIQFDDMELEVNAVDLGYLESEMDNINISEKVKVISNTHGLNRFFPVKKISIPINDPAHTTFTMGAAVKTKLTVRTNTGTGYIEDLIDEIPSESEILAFAKRNATALIKANTTGYITITQRDNGTNELYITDVPLTTYDPEDPSKEASRYWEWNLDGLGYFNKNDSRFNNPEGLKLALTMDGAIVADFITAGVLNAEIIKAGVLKGYYNQDNWWDLSTGELHIKMESVDGLSTKFEVVEGKITSEVTRATEEEGRLSSKITQTADEILLEVSRTYETKGNVTSKISQKADEILLQVSQTYETKGNVTSKINQKADSILLEVSRTYETKDTVTSKINQKADSILLEVAGKYATTGSVQTAISLSESGILSTVSRDYTTKTTTERLESRVSQTETAITSKVSRNDVESIIEQKADSIRLKASNIVVSSTNFSVTSDGHMTCTDANIKGNITVGGTNSGSITVKNGSNNDRIRVDSYGIWFVNDWDRFHVDMDGNIACYSIYGNTNGEINGGKFVNHNGIDVWYGSYVYSGYTGRVGYRDQHGMKYFGFVNGIMVAPDTDSNFPY